MTNHQKNISQSGSQYFMQGFTLIRRKGLRRFVLVPLIVNLVLFATAFYCVVQQLTHYMVLIEQALPDFLSWLSSVLWPIALLFILFMFSFIFSAVANWLAAPFNGLLSEKVESMLTKAPAPASGLTDIAKDIPRTLSREWCKFKYYLPKALGFFILYWIIPIVGQVIWFLFLSWMMAIQYKDYPFDNHKINFDEMRAALTQKRKLSYSFGVTAAVFSMIPLINMIVMPVAICGATALWVDHYRDEYQ